MTNVSKISEGSPSGVGPRSSLPVPIPLLPVVLALSYLLSSHRKHVKIPMVKQ